MSIYIAHRRRKTSNALDTLVVSERECFQWTSKRLVTIHVGSRMSADSEFQVVGPTIFGKSHESASLYLLWFL